MNDRSNDMDAFKELMVRSPDMELMTLDDLHGMVFWSGAAMKWATTQISIAKEMGGMTAQIDAWQKEGNAAAELNFAARAKRGELAKKEAKVTGNQNIGSPVSSGSSDPKWKRLCYKSEQAMYDDELLSNHPEIVEKVKQAAKEADDFPSVTAVKSEVRAMKAEKRAVEAEAREAKAETKLIKKTPTEHPKAVKDYLVACSVYRDALELAIRAAKASMFDPSAINMINTKHDVIRDLMNTMEELV